MANPSASTIIGTARTLIRAESGTDIPALQDSFLFTVLTDIDFEVRRAFRVSGGNTPSAIARETGYTLITDTTLEEDITTAATDFDVTSASSFPTSGALVIWDNDMFDIVYFTGKSSNNFTGVTGIGFSHEDNDGVQALYALPSNFAQFRRSEEYGDGVQLNGAPLRFMEGPPNPGYFSLVDDGTTKYLWLYRGASGDASVLYDKTSDAIDSSEDLISYGPEWIFFYAWRCIELGAFGRGDYELMQLAKQKADEIKLSLLKDRNVGRLVRVRPLRMFGSRTDYLPALEDD